MLCKQMAKVAGTKGATELKSFKEIKAHGYEVHILGANVGDNVGLKKAKSTKDPKKKMVCKLIELKHCTPRYKITMELYSLKIMRFIGKKPMMECFPKVYDIFLVRKMRRMISCLVDFANISIPFLPNRPKRRTSSS